MRLRVLPLLVAAPAAPAAAGPPYTALVVAAYPRTPAPGSQLGTEVFEDRKVTTSARTARQVVVVGTDAAGNRTSIALIPPTGTRLRTGASVDVAATADATHGTATVTWNGASCTATAGSFYVYDATVTGSRLTSLAADFRADCADTRFSGTVRLTSPVDWNAYVSTPTPTQLGAVYVGDQVTSTVTLTLAGPRPGRNGTPGYDRDDPDFHVLSTTCDHALAPGETCQFQILFAPLTPGPKGFVVDPGDDVESAFGIVATAVDPAAGTFSASTGRVLDTRTDLGFHHRPLEPREIFPLVFGALPGHAYVFNVTVVNPTAAGWVTLRPSSNDMPATSTVNFAAGETRANLVTVVPGINDTVGLYNAIGRVDVVVDVVGVYTTVNPSDAEQSRRAGGYHPTYPRRALDTRTWGYGQLPPGQFARIPVRYADDGAHVNAVAVNITATNAGAAGYLSAGNGGAVAAPSTSALNFTAGATVANSAVVPVAYCGAGAGRADGDCGADAVFGVYNGSSAPVDVIVDVTGFYDDGALPADVRYRPLPNGAYRLADTRSGLGLRRFGPAQTQVLAPQNVVDRGTVGLDANVTAVSPTASTFLTTWPSGADYPRPAASTLNAGPGQIVANHAFAQTGKGGALNLYNNAGALDLVVDVSGTFELFPDPDAGGPQQPTTYAAAPTASAPRPVPVAR